ncbi:MAG: oligosaccharide flippase family protein [Candidatus Omnitrophota bacterium]|jgi:O-antigen/teichoic acid export membrane protein
MYSYLKNITRHSAIYSIGSLAALLPGFILIPLYTRYFTPAEYGAITLVLLFSNVLMMFYEGGMVSALSRQYFEYGEDDPSGRKAVASTSFLFVMSTAIIVSIPVFIFSGQISQLITSTDKYVNLVRIMSISTLFGAMSVIPQTLARLQQKSLLYICISITMVLLSICLNVIFLVVFKMGVESIFYANLISVLAGTALFISAMSGSLIPWKFSRRDLSAMVKFGMMLLPAALMAWVIDYSGRYILEKLVNLHDVGVYSLGNKISQVMMMVVKAFIAAWFPVIFSIIEEKNSMQIFGNMFTYCIFGFAIFAMGISVFGREIIRILCKGDYLEAYTVMPFITISYMLFGAYLFFVSFLVMKKRFDTQCFLLLIAAGASVILNILLIPVMGMMGCAVSAVISYALLSFSTFKYVRLHYPIPIETGRILKMAVPMLVVIFIGSYIKIEPIVLAIVVKTFLIALYAAVLYKLGFFHKEEIAKLKSYFKRGRANLIERFSGEL